MTPTVKMIQVNPSKWKVVSTTTGAILQEDIKLRDVFEAHDYIKNYCTSFQAWSYEVVPLKVVD